MMPSPPQKESSSSKTSPPGVDRVPLVKVQPFNLLLDDFAICSSSIQKMLLVMLGRSAFHPGRKGGRQELNAPAAQKVEMVVGESMMVSSLQTQLSRDKHGEGCEESLCGQEELHDLQALIPLRPPKSSRDPENHAICPTFFASRAPSDGDRHTLATRGVKKMTRREGGSAHMNIHPVLRLAAAL